MTDENVERQVELFRKFIKIKQDDLIISCERVRVRIGPNGVPVTSRKRSTNRPRWTEPWHKVPCRKWLGAAVSRSVCTRSRWSTNS